MVRLKTDEEWGEIWNEEFKKRLKENKPYPYVNEKMADYLEHSHVVAEVTKIWKN